MLHVDDAAQMQSGWLLAMRILIQSVVIDNVKEGISHLSELQQRGAGLR